MRRPKTIYRACPCGETAHDLVSLQVGTQARAWRDGTWAYRCRNCRAERPAPRRRKDREDTTTALGAEIGYQDSVEDGRVG